MANLQLNIEVNDEEFKDLCVNNINDLPKDKLEELLLKAVEVALIRDKDIPSYNSDSAILVRKAEIRDSWGGTTYKYQPTDLLKNVMEKVDLSPYTDKLAETIRDYILNNYEEIIKKYVIDSFASMLFTDNNKYEFKDSIISDVRNYIGK